MVRLLRRENHVFILIGLAVAIATPATTTGSAPTTVCKTQVVIGSIIPTKVCKPLAEWIEDRRSDDPYELQLVENFGVRTLTSWED